MLSEDINIKSYQWVNQFDPQHSFIQGKSYLFAKRILDLTIVILTMPAWLLVLGLVALIIWIQSPGAPVFFVQKRTGKGGMRFDMYKFRTMVPDAEALKAKYMHLNELQWPDFKITNDPRVTPIGRFLRKTSLDELPQMLNVLKGDMGLVGPRPTSFSPDTYRLWHTERLDVQPGVTGLWQIVGRGETEFDDRLRLDIIYIEKRCLTLDVMILVKTISSVLLRKGRH
jgi:lipopolysaccharide/colanic/teichoic acid biosynthesis glycosyltransferase